MGIYKIIRSYLHTINSIAGIASDLIEEEKGI
jgi:hypothetical protein